MQQFSLLISYLNCTWDGCEEWQKMLSSAKLGCSTGLRPSRASRAPYLLEREYEFAAIIWDLVTNSASSTYHCWEGSLNGHYTEFSDCGRKHRRWYSLGQSRLMLMESGDSIANLLLNLQTSQGRALSHEKEVHTAENLLHEKATGRRFEALIRMSPLWEKIPDLESIRWSYF